MIQNWDCYIFTHSKLQIYATYKELDAEKDRTVLILSLKPRMCLILIVDNKTMHIVVN